MATQQLPITSPIKGVVRVVPREGQPQETCWDAVNCLPYDRYGRKRVAQRTGIQKEFSNQLANSWVQGMIEAPNIIYPPGVLTQPIWSIADLPGFGPLTGPGPIGPFAYNGPTPAFTLQWEWDFVVSYSITATPGSSGWMVGDQMIALIYWPLNGVFADSLILAVICDGGLVDSSVGSQNFSLILSSGNPSTPFSGWTTLADLSYNTPPAGGDTFTGSVSGTLAINNLGNLLLTQSPNTLGSPAPVSYPFSVTEFPELNVQKVYRNGSTATNGSSYTSTISITD